MVNHNSKPINSNIDQLLQHLQTGELHYAELIDQCLSAALSAPAAHVFTKIYAESARAVAQQVDLLKGAGVSLPKLSGLPITIKD